jgi:NAD(P)-dependent dehydrogenase (short-subunit alcohol dehydrogenase family)
MPRRLVLLALGAAVPAQAQNAAPARAVLVTGASTGIGRKITEALAANGYFVYAGARKEQDLKDLSAIRNVQGVRLDVTVPADIAAAVRTVEQGGRGLYGLVNNAGVAVIAPVIEVDEEELRFQLDANVMGPYRVTKAFAPLLIASKGRVVMTGSLSGFLSGMLSGPYSMSKHALEAYSDALAAEMRRFDVRVSILEPGNYKSDIGKSLLARMKARGQSVESSRYRKELEGFMKAGLAENDPEPDDVAQAALHALGDPNPQLRYLVVPAQGQAAVTIQKLLVTVAQLNQGHRFSYSRDSLVAMLDRSLARVDSATGSGRR